MHLATFNDDSASAAYQVSKNDYRGDCLGEISHRHFEIINIDRVPLIGHNVSVQAISSDQPGLIYWGFDRNLLIEAHSQDPDLRYILDWIKTKQEPTEGYLFRSSPTIKSYWVNKEMFTLSSGVLWRKNSEDEGKVLVVPVTLKNEILELNHDLPSGGHQGMKRTKEKLKNFWYGMTADVRRYVSSCARCNQSKKATRRSKSPLGDFQAGSPMERVHIDFLGPLTRTDRGNEHVLMIVDQFTKCIPLSCQCVEVTARALVNEFFSRFGFPLEKFSDQGRNFQSNLFAKLCEITQIHQARTTPYRPSGNGQVERFNRTLTDAVRCFIQNSPGSWDL